MRILVIVSFFVLVLGACTHRHVTANASGKTVYGEKAQVIDRLREAGSDFGGTEECTGQFHTRRGARKR